MSNSLTPSSNTISSPIPPELAKSTETNLPSPETPSTTTFVYTLTELQPAARTIPGSGQPFKANHAKPNNDSYNDGSRKRQRTENNVITIYKRDMQESDIETIVNILTESVNRVQNGLQQAMDKQVVGLDDAAKAEYNVVVLKASFIATYMLYIQHVLNDLMPNTLIEEYMTIFDEHDTAQLQHILHQSWSAFVANDLRANIDATGIRFTSLKWNDTILTRFYNECYLEVAAAKQRKDHGQFYTPHPVVEFMWNTCLTPQHLVGALTTSKLPRVFDPCMGIGAFLGGFLTRVVEAASMNTQVWNDTQRLQTLLTAEIPKNIWGVEIDPFAFDLGKLNTLIHLFPLYKRLLELGVKLEPRSVGRLRYFCNDTLKLAVPPERPCDEWEKEHLLQLRDAKALKFDYIVTNPPYMIRKTGFISVPDPLIYDEQALGGRGSQAYLYFMWLCFQRCDPIHGQVCLITPSQWIHLEFAKNIRTYMWQHCHLTEVYQFGPYKVWPKVQTDSLVFKLRMRTPTSEGDTKFLRHVSRKADLEEILRAYESFDLSNPNPDIEFKITLINPVDRIFNSANASFTFLSPSSDLSSQLEQLTRHLPRLCGDKKSSPLTFHRGPNTHPVYALVVRTRWALETFGADCCQRWLRPVLYWNGKATTSGNIAADKESLFWQNRDPFRLTRKENSPAEAYAPFCPTEDEHDPQQSFYSIILVDKQGADILEEDFASEQRYAALYQYLREARNELQASKIDRNLAWCNYNQCGMNFPVKIIHPINCGYFTRSQPRQRFFIDRQQYCVTNQCMYFVIHPQCQWQSAEFFCGILNSSTIQFFIREHCFYDQQGRTRFFAKHLANIPFAPPTADDVEAMTSLVACMTNIRERLFHIARCTGAKASILQCLRGCTWDLSATEKAELDNNPHPSTAAAAAAGTATALLASYPPLIPNTTCVSEETTRLLKVASLLQHCIDQLTFAIYRIPHELQQSLEQELNLQLTQKWHGYLQRRNLENVYEDRTCWVRCLMDVISSIVTSE